jgi:hypothetical protein
MQQTLTPEAITSDQPRSLGSLNAIRVFTSKFWSEALIITVAVVLWIPRLSGPIDLRWDAGVYYILGTSLTSGHGYRIESEPGAPAALQYPPLLPTIISLHQRVLGTTDPNIVGAWLRITYAFLFLMYGISVLRLAKRYLQPATATLATLLCLLNPFTIYLSDLLFAEVPFALISVLFALVGSAVVVRRQWLHELVCFVLATCGFLLRSAGIVLLVAWVLDAVMRKRWRLFVVRAAVSLIPFVTWQAYVSHVLSSTEYLRPAYEYQRAPYQYYNVSYFDNIRLIDPFQPELGTVDAHAFGSRVIKNLAIIPGAIGQIITAKDKDWRGTAVWLQGLISGHRLFPIRLVRIPLFGLGFLAIVGVVTFVRRGAWIMTFVIVGSFGLVCLTPWPRQFTRYLAPLTPFLTISVVLGAVATTAAVAKRTTARAAVITRWLAGTLIFLAVIVELHTAAWLFSERARQPAVFLRSKTDKQPKWFLYDQSWQAWQEGVDWIDKHAPPEAIIATSSPHFYFLQTGRLAVLPPMVVDRTEERRLLASVPVSYAIVDQLEFPDITRRYLEPALKVDPSWRLVHTSHETSVYERRP